ncbi:MAG: quinone-dependent dihydroorotate dehydrogenase [Nostocoides sp.]
MGIYQAVFDQVLTRVDPESTHRASFGALRALAKVPGAIGTARSRVIPDGPDLAVRVFGKTLPHPIGLAAGFDKNGEGIDALAGLGFAAVEIGTVTASAQPGNEPPRLFRLPADRAIVNRMGFNNQGCVAVAARLARRAHQRRRTDVLLGVNIGKTKVVPVQQAPADYATAAARLAPYADYLVVNVSSPNTPGLRDLQAITSLRPILEATRSAAIRSAGKPVPLLVKIAPDLSDPDIVAVADLVTDLDLDGVVATNTTIARAGLNSPPELVAAAGEGGLSGPVLAGRSEAVLTLLRQHLPQASVVISVGGINTAADVSRRLELGATLVQVYTGLIYGGPLWVRDTLRDLARTPNRPAPKRSPQ